MSDLGGVAAVGTGAAGGVGRALAEAVLAEPDHVPQTVH
jgi:NAD(P)-dependent dehydrogenase (short-subunit alcohol dehydrogenase family)